MRCLIGSVSILALVAGVSAQEPHSTSRPSSQPAPVAKKARNGGFYGIWFTEVPQDEGAHLRIESVLEGSDAERLGFYAGDHITAVNGVAIEDGDHFIKLLYATLEGPVGDEMRQWLSIEQPEDGPFFTVYRGGATATIRGGLTDLDAHPKVGEKAPDFTLASPDGKSSVTLSQRIGSKPVVLVFGSYT